MRLMRMLPLPDAVVSELAGLGGGSLEAAGRLAEEALRGWLDYQRALGAPPSPPWAAVPAAGAGEAAR